MAKWALLLLVLFGPINGISWEHRSARSLQNSGATADFKSIGSSPASRSESILVLDGKNYDAAPDLGATINKMIADLPRIGGYASGMIVIPGGSYVQSSKVSVESPYLSILGIGSGSVQITCKMDSDCWRIDTVPFTIAQAGKIAGFTLIGQPNHMAANGVHMGDIIGLQLDDVRITGFTGSASAGLWLDNVTGFTERTVLTKVHLDGNKKNMRFTVSGRDGSFGYNRFLDLRMNVNQDQIGFAMEGGVLYHSVIIATMNGGAATRGHSKTFISLTGTSAWVENTYTITSEDTSGGGGVVISTSPGTKFNGQGLLDNYNHPTGPAMTNAIAGNFDLYPLLFQTALPSFVSHDVNGTLSARQNSDSVGTSLIPDTGKAGNFLQGVGLNFAFDGSQWIANGDGENNGAFALLSSNGGQNGLGFYSVPSSGAKRQALSPSQLSRFLVGRVNTSGQAVFTKYANVSNCSSIASPAGCGSAPAGSVAVPASSGSLVIETSAVTLDSQIIVVPDSSLGQRLHLKCSSVPAQPMVTARTAGKSFTLRLAVVSPDPACFSYEIIN